MKARRVRKLDPDAPLADNAERIVRVRLDELCEFVPAALDPDQVVALHDMRIAAKRLRYLLEVTGFCFGPYASTAVKRAKALQDLLGEIHDCDVMLPRVREHVDELRAQDVAVLRRLAGGADDLDPAITRQAPNRAAYRRPRGARGAPAGAARAALRSVPGALAVLRAPGVPGEARVGARRAARARTRADDVGIAVAPEAVPPAATSLGVPPSPGDDPAATMAAAMDVAAVSGGDGASDEEGTPARTRPEDPDEHLRPHHPRVRRGA